MTQIFKLSCVSFSYVSISYVLAFPDDFKSGSKIMLIQLPKTRQPYFAFSTEGNLINFIRADLSKDIIQYHQDFFYMISLPYDN